MRNIDSVTSIGNYAFSGCTGLIAIEYGGSETDWNDIYIGSGNDALLNSNIIFNSKIPPKPSVVIDTTETTYQFAVSVDVPKPNCYVYAAVYDATGNITEMRRVPLEGAGSTVVDVAKTDSDKAAKIFVWNDKMQPITSTVELEL